MEIATEIEAHNMAFEYAIWKNVCEKRYGWPPLPTEKLRCSAAKAAMHSLPRRLEDACNALALPVGKDVEGYRLMLKLCKPRRRRKAEPEINPDDEFGLYWFNDPEDFARLYEYCLNDVRAEEALSDALRDLPRKELEIFRLDQAINERGIMADLNVCAAMIQFINDHERRLLGQLRTLTQGRVKSAKQVDVLLNYLESQGVLLPDLAAATVEQALKGDLNAVAKDVLEIRRSLGRSSAAKYSAIMDRASRDGRVRGALLYHGAGTGRWAGAGIQPQNFPSRIKTSAPPEELVECILAGGLPLFQALYEDDPMAAAGACTRSALVAAPGRDLLAADFSAVEGRGLAWLAGEENELAIYRSDADVYVATAAMILHKPYNQVTKEERQKPGKIATLACGYQGGVGAVRKFGGDGMTDEEIKSQIVDPWREAHPMTVRFWHNLEAACMDAVRNPGRVVNAREISFKVANRFLLARLPSGRILYYYDPQIREVETKWGEMKEVVTYMTVDSYTKHWTRAATYGGKLAENVTQATCRDLMAEAMLRVETAGYPIVLTVHDEILAEVPEGYGSLEEFCSLMEEVPRWASGFPVKAAGWRGKRYRK
jgi:DNA polymerase